MKVGRRKFIKSALAAMVGIGAVPSALLAGSNQTGIEDQLAASALGAVNGNVSYVDWKTYHASVVLNEKRIARILGSDFSVDLIK